MAKAPNDKASKAEGKPDKGKPEVSSETTDKAEKSNAKAAKAAKADESKAAPAAEGGETKTDGAAAAAPGEKVRQKPRDNKPRTKAPYVRRTGRAAASTGHEPTKRYTVGEAVAIVKKASFAKFDETVDLAVRLGVNPKHADQMVRGALVLPHGTGQSLKVAVFAKGEKAAEARAAGADEVGSDDLAAKVQGGYLEFDRVIATPDMMGVVGKLGRILGPRGLMPNPKVGTVTFDVTGAVREAKAGKIEYRVEKAGIVHARIGKRSFEDQALAANALALIDALVRAKPSTAKGIYLRSITVSSTMGPGVKIDPLSVTAKSEEA